MNFRPQTDRCCTKDDELSTTKSDGFLHSNELDDYLNEGNVTRFPHVDAVTGAVDFVRTRGESSDTINSHPAIAALDFWENPSWNMLAMLV